MKSFHEEKYDTVLPQSNTQLCGLTFGPTSPLLPISPCIITKQ